MTSTMVCIDTLAMPAEECLEDLRIFIANAQIQQMCRIEASEKSREIHPAYSARQGTLAATMKPRHGGALPEAIYLNQHT